MGAKPSVKLTPNTDSIMEPGQKVVVSEPLEVDPNVLLEELLEQMRYPIDSMKEYVLKSCDVEEHSASEFTVKVVLDGKKLDKYRYGKGDGTDRIDVWTRVVADRKAQRIESRPIVAPPGCWADEMVSVNSGGYGRIEILMDPVRVEFHIVTHDGQRMAEEQAVGALQPTLASALTTMDKRKVKIMAEQDSLSGSGLKSVISEPMDEHTDFDTFWDKFLATMKSPPGAPLKPEVIEVSAGEFHTVITVPDTKQKMVTKVQHCKASGEITTETFTDGEKVSGSGVTLHKKPLRVESWGQDANSMRQSGRGVAKALQEYVDVVLAKKSRRWFH